MRTDEEIEQEIAELRKQLENDFYEGIHSTIRVQISTLLWALGYQSLESTTKRDKK